MITIEITADASSAVGLESLYPIDAVHEHVDVPHNSVTIEHSFQGDFIVSRLSDRRLLLTDLIITAARFYVVSGGATSHLNKRVSNTFWTKMEKKIGRPVGFHGLEWL